MMVDVQTFSGVVRGGSEGGISHFLGVSYAAAPFDGFRMRPPAPVSWSGVRDATAYGPTPPKGDYPPAIQLYFPEQTIHGDECLNLNVWTPTDAVEGERAGSLPVLVWIHGGAFMNGSGSVTAYDGTGFARSGVVCVTINYRLGAEGFLFTEADLGTGTANLGLQDQVAALQWVQQNISAFGGDPARVTIAGESAGGMSVTTLLAMPSAKGLFARAITQSGAAANTLTPEQGLLVAGLLAHVLGTATTREAILTAELDSITKAASDLVVEVQSAADPAKWGELALSTLPFAPVVDGVVLPRHPLEAFADGVSSEVPVLVGTNSQEARLFLVATGAIDGIDEAGLAAGAGAYGATGEGIDVYRRHFPDDSPGDLLAHIVTDWYFGLPALRHAEAREQGGGLTWAYRFDRPLPEENNGLGAAHAVELPFVFDTIDLPEQAPMVGQEPSRAVAESTHGVWVRFVTEGNPGWEPYTTQTRATGILTECVTVVDDPDGDLRRSWNGIR